MGERKTLTGSCEGYRIAGFWGARALHYGWWDETTSSLTAALNHENEVLAARAGIQPGEDILDAGCGIGGSSMYLASIGANVTGITISPRQVELATRNAQRAGLSDRAQFAERDFTATKYPDNSFDVVWALESVGHVPRKDDFIEEAARLLRPGGRLIMADGWATYADGNNHPAMRSLLAGWGSRDVNLDTLERFAASLGQHGFQDIRTSDETAHIVPTIEHLYKWYRRTRILHALLQKAGLRNDVQAHNHRTAKDQYDAWQADVLTYGVVQARLG